MENVIGIIISSILSGILATIITLIWQDYSEKSRIKREIFTTLMAYRFNLADKESVKALNCIQVIFFNNNEVRNAWQKFKEAADAKPFDRQKLIDAHITLLEKIAKVLKYKNINWSEIKNSYYPEAMAQEINENTALRKAQLNILSGAGQSSHSN